MKSHYIPLSNWPVPLVAFDQGCSRVSGCRLLYLSQLWGHLTLHKVGVYYQPCPEWERWNWGSSAAVTSTLAGVHILRASPSFLAQINQSFYITIWLSGWAFELLPSPSPQNLSLKLYLPIQSCHLAYSSNFPRVYASTHAPALH